MEDWNWQQILGLTLLIVGGTCGFIGGLALLASMFSYKYRFVILIALMLLMVRVFGYSEKRKEASHERKRVLRHSEGDA